MKRTESQSTRQSTLFDQCIITAFLRSTIDSDGQEVSQSSGSSALTWKDYAIPAALFLFIMSLIAYEHYFG